MHAGTRGEHTGMGHPAADLDFPEMLYVRADMHLRLIPEFGGPDNTQPLLGNAQVGCNVT